METFLTSLITTVVTSAVFWKVFGKMLSDQALERTKAELTKKNAISHLNYQSKLELYQESLKQVSKLAAGVDYVFGLKNYADQNTRKDELQKEIMLLRLELLTGLAVFASENVLQKALKLTDYLFICAYESNGAIYEGHKLSECGIELLNAIRTELGLGKTDISFVITNNIDID